MALSARQDHPPFLSEENGHIPARDLRQNWLVVVTREALEEAAEPADASLARLLEYRTLFLDVATFKLEHGRAGDEDTIWIQTDDLREWHSLQAK